ncbi:hypothetical protein CCHL11_01689 [Colletotrichum chlorophyti]|uniref:Uncharacterized protein n=1 Tax=Colletotrichum chlorophyti TaxID=708187 RepID=A0A1Q8RW32_9PEZI|nr:hypothetical protein CCHL11_01689 [Colletotrichum chlorophyti]
MAQVDHEVVIFADESIASSSTSISSSILDYRIENGRTYHRYKDGNLQHEIFVYTLNDELGLAPPCRKNVKVGRVLDVGTGTGSWAMDFGDLHPESEVLGVDLSPPRADFVPPNVKFEVDDIEEEWLYSRPFEYIHSRFMTASISNWKEYLVRCFDNLIPGGYLELQDADLFPRSDDGTFPKDCALVKFAQLLHSVSEKMGREYVDVPSLKKVMTDVGFVDVELQMYKWPHNAWPKEDRYKKLGLWTQENFGSALEAMCMAPFTRVLGWNRIEVDVFLIDVRNDLKNKSHHSYTPVYCIVGRKPEKQDRPAPA